MVKENETNEKETKRITDEELNQVKKTVLKFLDDAKQVVLDDFYIPEKQEDIIECVLSQMAGNLLYVTAMRYALYHDYEKVREMVALSKEGYPDDLFDLAIMLEDQYGGTGSNREREVKELATKILELLNYNRPNQRYERIGQKWFNIEGRRNLTFFFYQHYKLQ